MQADYKLELTIEGNADDLLRMLEIVGLYTGDRPQRFTDIIVNGEEIDLIKLTESIVQEISETGKINISAKGPWGGYGRLDDVGLFREMAEAAPKAHFTAQISGSETYAVQNLVCELKEGLLNVETYYEENGELEDAWAEYFVKELPYADFKTLFKVSGKDFDEQEYLNLAESLSDVFCYSIAY